MFKWSGFFFFYDLKMIACIQCNSSPNHRMGVWPNNPEAQSHRFYLQGWLSSLCFSVNWSRSKPQSQAFFCDRLLQTLQFNNQIKLCGNATLLVDTWVIAFIQRTESLSGPRHHMAATHRSWSKCKRKKFLILFSLRFIPLPLAVSWYINLHYDLGRIHWLLQGEVFWY